MTTAPPLGFEAQLRAVGASLDGLIAQGSSDPYVRREQWLDALDGPLPEQGRTDAEMLALLTDVLAPNGMRLVQPEFSGWIITSPDPTGLAAVATAAVASPQRYTLTAFNHLEELSLRWLAELCGLDPDRMGGVYSSGGSVANLVALGAARQFAFERLGVDPAADGVGRHRTAIYASAETHHTVNRAAAVLGLGRSSVVIVPTDEQQRIRVDALRNLVTRDYEAGVVPIAIVANVGTTNTGAIDPVEAMADIAQSFDIWLHVDGAYGLPGILDDRVAHLYAGVERADSVIVDPHKWLGSPGGIGATYVRDRTILHRAFTQETAAYLESVFNPPADLASSTESMGIPYSEYGVELSAPARGTAVWSVLRRLGRSGVAANIRASRDLAAHLADRVRAHPRLELMHDPVLSICCFRYAAPDLGDGPSERADQLTSAIYQRLVRETPHVPSTTRIGGALAIRPCFINPRTTTEHVDALADAVTRLGDELTHRSAVR